MKNLLVRIGADMSALGRELKKAQQKVTDFSSNVNKSMAGVTAALAAVGAGLVLKNAVMEAVKVEGAIQSLNRMMGQSSQAFLDWANTQAISFGMSKAEALDYGRTFSIMTKSFSTSSKDSLKYTTDLLKQAAAVASMSGRSMQDVMERIASGLRGETDAIEDLGIQVSVSMIESTNAFKQFANGKSWAQLSAQTQAQIRYFAILEQATAVYGDKLGENTGSRINQFTASLKNLQLALGQAFTPIVNFILPILTTLAQKLTEVMVYVASFTKTLFGSGEEQAAKQEKAVNKVATAVSGVGDASKQAAKDQKGFLSGFDEINTVPAPQATASSGAGDQGASVDMGGASAAFEMGNAMDKVNEKAVALAESIKSFFRGIGEAFSWVWNSALVPLGTYIGGAFTTAWNGLKVAMEAIGTFLTSTFTLAWDGLKTTLETLYNWITSTFISMWDGLKTTYEEHATAINTVVGAITLFFLPALIKTGVEAAIAGGKIALNFIANVVKTGTEAVIAGSKIAINFVTSMIKSGAEAVVAGTKITLSFIASMIKAGAEAVVQAAKVSASFIASMITAGLEAVKTGAKITGSLIASMVAYGVQGWKTVGAIAAQTTALIAQGAQWIAQKVAMVTARVTTATMTAAQWALNAAMSANPIGLVIVAIGALVAAGVLLYQNWDTVKEYAQKLWDKMKDVGAGIKEALVTPIEMVWGAYKSYLNLIIGAVNKLIDGLNKLKLDVPDWVPGFGGKQLSINIPKIPELARGGIVDSPTMAMVGEAGKEMVVPLENTSFVDKLASALGTAVMSAMQMSGGSGKEQGRDVVIQIDGNTLARAINPYTTKEASRVGNSILSIT